MFKRMCVWFGALNLMFLIMFTSCKHGNKGGKSDIPTPKPKNEPAELISKIRIASGNGIVEVLYDGAEVNVKDKVDMQVMLNKDIVADDATISATFAGQTVSFSDFQKSWEGVASVLQDLQGVGTEAKEMVIEVKVGNNYQKRAFKLKILDETALPPLQLESFLIGKQDVVDRIATSPTWRIYDPASNKIKLTATLNQDLKEAIIIVNGKNKTLPLDDANKKTIMEEVEFEKNSIKKIAFVFRAEGAKDFTINPFILIFTNTVAPVVEVQASNFPEVVSDEQLIMGRLTYPKCMIQEPKIIVKSLLDYGNKITKVSVDGVDVEIKTDDPNVPTATYTLNPPLEKAGSTKTVKVRVEGVHIDQGQETEKEPLEFEVTFTLVQFIEATLQIKEGAGEWQDLQGEKRVYEQNIKIKLIAKDDNFTDVKFKNYKDADENTPDFDIDGKEAIASIKLKDTGHEPSSIKIIAEAPDKSTTEFVAHIRYTAQDDPLGLFGGRFDYGNIEKTPDPTDGSDRMTRLRATFRVLVSRNCDAITSIKINDKEVLDEAPYSDPDQIVEKAMGTAEMGPAGKSVNAVIVIGNDNMKKDHVYTLNISIAGKTADGHNLTAANLSPIKIKLPDHGDSNTDWLSPYGNDDMDLTLVSADYHEEDKAHKYWNYYGVKRITGAVDPKNPEATVEGFWYKHDTSESEWTKIITEGKMNPKWADRFFKFKEVETITGRSKWGFDLDLTTADKEGNGIGIYLYVVAKDGSTNKMTWPQEAKVNVPYRQIFRRLDLSASYTKLGNDIGWANGWKDAMQFTDELTVDLSKCTDNKLYFRATTFIWNQDIEYHLFDDAPQPPISDFVCIDDANHWRYDNRFTLDVSALQTKEEMEVEIPVYLRQVIKDNAGNITGEVFKANVFTRKFKIKKK